MKILIIEDDENIVDYIRNVFQIGWPKAKIISTHLGQRGIELVGREAPDVVILDLGLPDLDGFEVLKQIRLFSSVLIIILSVRGEEPDVVKGLGLGADEYVVKPFRQLELLARVRALARRQKPLKQDLSIVYGPLRFGYSLCDVVYGEGEITLTNTEGRILYELMAKKGGVVTHSETWNKSGQ